MPDNEPDLVSPDLYLTYRFRHSSTNDQLVGGDHLTSWRHWFTRLRIGTFAIALDHSYSLTPPLRAMMYPEFFGLTHDEAMAGGFPAGLTTQELRAEMRRRDPRRNQDWRRAYQHRSLRLTWNASTLWVRSDLELLAQHEDGHNVYTFKIDWVDALLLPDNIGVLVVKITADVTDLEHLAEFSRNIKKVLYRRRLTLTMPTLKLANGSTSTWATFLDAALSDLQDGELDARQHSSNSEYSETEGVNWQLAIAFGLAPSYAADPFQSGLEQAAFAVAVGRGPNQLTNLPTHSFMERLRGVSVVEPWDSWYALYHYDNFVFVADTSDERRLHEYVDQHKEIFEHEYLILLCVAQAQRAAIDLITSDLATLSASMNEALTELDNLERLLARFNTRLWFDQTGTTPVGQPLYSMLRDSLALPTRRTQVHDDAARLRNHLEARQLRAQARSTRRAELLLVVLTIFLLPATAYVTLLQPRLIPPDGLRWLSPEWAWSGATALTLFSASATAWLVIRGRGRDDEV